MFPGRSSLSLSIARHMAGSRRRLCRMRLSETEVTTNVLWRHSGAPARWIMFAVYSPMARISLWHRGPACRRCKERCGHKRRHSSRARPARRSGGILLSLGLLCRERRTQRETMTFLRVLSCLAAEATIRCAVHNKNCIRARFTNGLYAPTECRPSVRPWRKAVSRFFIPRCGPAMGESQEFCLINSIT